MPVELFNVVVIDPDDFWRYSARDLPAREAVWAARTLADMATTPAGTDTHRVMITDSGDNTVFLWERGRGVVFPTREEVT